MQNVTYCMFTYCMHNGIINDEVNFVDVLRVFASNLKKYRNKVGLSQEAFAEKAGLHRTYISAVECGKRSIALENVQKIADALDVETHLLFIEEKRGH